MQFAYTGELREDMNNVQSCYAAADYFQIEKIKAFCEKFIVEILATVNVFVVFHLVEFNTSVSLIKRANTFISNHFVEVTSVTNDDFFALEKDS